MNKSIFVFCLSFVPAVAMAQQAEPKLVYEESDQQRIDMGKKDISDLKETFDVMINNMSEKERDALAKNFSIVEAKRAKRLPNNGSVIDDDVALTEYKGELGHVLTEPLDVGGYAPLSEPKEVTDEQ